MATARRVVDLCFCGLVVCGIIVTDAGAQTPVPPIEEPRSDRREASINLDVKTKRIADEYLALLQELEALAHDYGQFYALYSTVAAKENFRTLQGVSAQLRRGSYNGDIQQLEDELRSLAENLQTQEIELRQRVAERKVYSATRVLRQELEVVRCLLQRDIVRQIQNQSDKMLLMKAYLDGQLGKLQAGDRIRRLAEAPSPKAATETESEETVATEPRELSGAVDTTPPTPPAPWPSTAGRPPMPEPPNVVTVTADRDITYLRPSGEAGLVMELSDSLLLASGQTLISISSPIGKVNIFTGESGKVLAQLDIEIAADTREKARGIADRVSLQLSSGDREVRIEPLLPNLEDPAVKVVSASLTIKIPAGNPLLCNSAFGEVSVTGLQGDVKIDGSNSQITVSAVTGNLDISDHAGAVTLERVAGNARVKNAFGPITAFACVGSLDLENSLAPISVSQCSGDTHIRNSGEIKVHNHEGQVTIKNGNGLVEIKNLNGDLWANNSFKALTVEDVSGNIRVENSNAAIDARRVAGQVTANNRSGDIFAVAVRGAINLNNQNGNITVSLDSRTSGESFITAAFGNIDIDLPQKINLLIKAQTLGGNIESVFPSSVSARDSLKTMELTFGTAINTLNVSGKHTVITISEAH